MNSREAQHKGYTAHPTVYQAQLLADVSMERMGAGMCNGKQEWQHGPRETEHQENVGTEVTSQSLSAGLGASVHI